MDVEKITEAGRIASEVVSYSKGFIKSGMKLLDIAEKIEDKIFELGGKPAFAVTLCINEIAAHATPVWNSEEVARGLLKVDLGVHIDGWCSDTAFSLDLEDNKENKKLIEVAEAGLKEGLNKIDIGIELSEVGNVINETIKESEFSSIINLSGHSIERYDLHSGITVPNFDNRDNQELEEGLYAVEPFVTNGFGKVRDGKPSGIFQIQGEGNVRDNFAREVLKFIDEEYQGLPFCSRWIYKKFKGRGLLAIKQIKQAGLLHEFAQLVEAGGGKVAQAEHSVLLKDGKLITTK